MKQLREVRHPMTHCTPLRSLIDLMLMMVAIFLEFPPIPRLETKKPNNMPPGTPKTHFLGFSLMLLAISLSNANPRPDTWPSDCRVLTMMSSTYTCKRRGHIIVRVERCDERGGQLLEFLHRDFV
jgi:hypothetical protein